MKTKSFIIISFTFLLFSSCRKLTYPENDGIEIKQKDFYKTINGVWQIEHVWFKCHYGDTSCTHPPIDSGAIYIAKFGVKGTLEIDYGKTFDIKWHGNRLNFVFFENNKTYFDLGNLLNMDIIDTNSIITSIHKSSAWYNIEKLTPSDLKLKSNLFMTLELKKL
jgi:hypothetical protein